MRLALVVGAGGVASVLVRVPLAGAEPAASAATGEYQVKAAFLFNFAQFVEWPAPAFAERSTPLTIGICGPDPFGAYLDELVRGESVGGRPIAVKRFQEPAEIKDCHILFISVADPARVQGIIAALKGRSILTVGDGENFSQQGGMVRFVTESGKIRLRINVEAARSEGLIISSKILRPATIVTKDKR
jgi:hypothetical protein